MEFASPVKLRLAAAELILFAGRFLDAQPANAAAGAAGNFQLGTYEPFARRSFRLPLRGRDCTSARYIAFRAHPFL